MKFEWELGAPLWCFSRDRFQIDLKPIGRKIQGGFLVPISVDFRVNLRGHMVFLLISVSLGVAARGFSSVPFEKLLNRRQCAELGRKAECLRFLICQRNDGERPAFDGNLLAVASHEMSNLEVDGDFHNEVPVLSGIGELGRYERDSDLPQMPQVVFAGEF